jgi:CheY-like chemotaxis protein
MGRYPGLNALAQTPRRILVVDDNADTRDLYEALLSEHGHELTVVATGNAGLALLLVDTFDVAVIDIGLPDIDGYQIARTVKAALGARAPVLIAITGYVAQEDREAAARAGFDAHLPKPIDADVLGLAVTTTFAR